MERLPDSLAIGLWIAGSMWALALLAYVLDASTEWVFPLLVLGVLAGVAEWIVRQEK